MLYEYDGQIIEMEHLKNLASYLGEKLEVREDSVRVAHIEAKAFHTGYDWAEIAQECQDNGGLTWLGTVYGIFPSGKYYTFWTSNASEYEHNQDALFLQAMEEEANAYGLHIEFKGDDIYATNDQYVEDMW